MSQKYKVVTVPKIWVNDKVFIDGAAPTREMMAATFVRMIEQALDDSIPPGKLSLIGPD
ncbi:thioredoxin family protein [bacterium]|nr:thioredoxin family protein [bacterium]